jgi:glycine betaine/proline transport system permease protein
MLALLQEDLIPKIPLADLVEDFVDFITDNFRFLFNGIRNAIAFFVESLEAILITPPELVMVAIFAVIAYFLSGWKTAIFSVIGFVLLIALQASGQSLWEPAMLTLALVLASTVVSLIIGVPIGILAAKSRAVEVAVKPVLDLMQTMPAFVYLVPMIVFLGLGPGPGLVATVIFAAPPAVRLTMLGIQQVPRNTVEAAQAFGATPWQTLRKVELPQALPTIMAGVNQVIMLALSMVVIAALVGAGGLGEVVTRGLSQLRVGNAFVGGLGIVIIAVYLDRVTRNLGRTTQRKPGKGGVITKVFPGKKVDREDPNTAGARAGTGGGSP